jgi:hypothetical protein
MNEHLTEEDRDMLNMLHNVCWECAGASWDLPSWERMSKYRTAQHALKEVLVDLLEAKMGENK